MRRSMAPVIQLLRANWMAHLMRVRVRVRDRVRARVRVRVRVRARVRVLLGDVARRLDEVQRARDEGVKHPGEGEGEGEG